MYALEYIVNGHVCVLHFNDTGDFQELVVAKKSINFEDLLINQIQFSKKVADNNDYGMHMYERKAVVTLDDQHAREFIEEIVKDPDELKTFVMNLIDHSNKIYKHAYLH